MDLGPHAGHILAAYAAVALVIAGLAVWVVADHRAQRRILAELDAKGVRRRSSPSADEIA